MVNSDADNFKAMMNALYMLYGKRAPDNEALRAWWMKLSKIELNLISDAMDTWSDTKTTFPTVADILPLCKKKDPVYVQVGKKLTEEELAANHKKLSRISASLNKKPARDWVKYWTDILDNPQGLPEITLVGARQALVNLGVRKA